MTVTWLRSRPQTAHASGIRVCMPRLAVLDARLQDWTPVSLPLPRNRLLAVGEGIVAEMVEATTARRSAWIGSTIAVNGSILLITPVDPLLVGLGLLDAAIQDTRAVFCPLEQLFVPSESVPVQLVQILLQAPWRCVCDTKEAGDLVVYRLSDAKVQSWLAAKVERVSKVMAQMPEYVLHPARVTAAAVAIVAAYVSKDRADRLWSAFAVQPGDDAPPIHIAITEGGDRKRKLNAKASRGKQAKATGMRSIKSFFSWFVFVCPVYRCGEEDSQGPAAVQPAASQ